ncbi:glyoxalase superfamily protein [Pelagibacterium montanilacus]|uniref:glyoxalase superfamily protein n=1 Tax=Pelagibacterium montanilacus TaxID=2185280 RepID=UPI000F8EE72F|nr:glyoxalase superfamily protein [Pelagibacterium montanilacus]
MNSQSISAFKAQARAHKMALGEAGLPITHSQALEHVARVHGYRDWNTASAMLSRPARLALSLGQRVTGRYLKQPFTGTVIALEATADPTATRVTVAFDAPVDVVTFESFSALRHRANATIGPDRRSRARTSDGEPHMILDA